MRLGGVDPSILRELSGVYKPFVKAFKELISNAFDADAQSVLVEFADDFTSVAVTDDGCGMTALEFRNDFTRIGGGSRRWAGDRTRRGRPRIGSKGIGFLALARYCDKLIVESFANRQSKFSCPIERPGRTIQVLDVLGVPVPVALLAKRLTCTINELGSGRRRFTQGRDFELDDTHQTIAFANKPGPVAINVALDCRNLAFKAVLDFTRLLRLADTADLEALEDFADIAVFEPVAALVRPGTRIEACGLKKFVCREMRQDRKRGNVRNIVSRSGFDQFVWHLARCTPVNYVASPDGATGTIGYRLKAIRQPALKQVLVCHAQAKHVVSRPVYPLDPQSQPLHPDMLFNVDIKESGLHARGFLAGYESVIFPAEYRGISIRVRGVAIGDPNFLGAENMLTGANKAALSQITGEVIVKTGLHAADAVNPGRESFYEENEHFKVLRQHLIGEGEHVGGYLGQAIAAVLRRSQVRSALADVLGRASLRHHALEDVAAAFTHLLGHRPQIASSLRHLLRSRHEHVNGLPGLPDYQLDMPDRIGGLEVLRAQHLPVSAEPDFTAGRVRIDESRPEWSWHLRLHDRSFVVVHKRGRPDHPIAEMDLKADRIYINWGHPIRQQMDERGFLRFALAWTVAKEAACEDGTQMMELALELMAFSGEKHA